MSHRVNTNHGDQKVLRSLITEDVKCLNMCPLSKSGFKDYESRSVGYLYWLLFGDDLNWHTAAADCLGTLAITRFMAEQFSLDLAPVTEESYDKLTPVGQDDKLVRAAAERLDIDDRLPTPEELAAANFVSETTLEMVEAMEKYQTSAKLLLLKTTSRRLLPLKKTSSKVPCFFLSQTQQSILSALIRRRHRGQRGPLSFCRTARRAGNLTG